MFYSSNDEVFSQCSRQASQLLLEFSLWRTLFIIAYCPLWGTKKTPKIMWVVKSTLKQGAGGGAMVKPGKGCERKKLVSGEGRERKWSGGQVSDFPLLVLLWGKMATPSDPLLKPKENKVHDKTRCSLKCQPALPRAPPPTPLPHVLSSKQYLEGRMGGACKGCERKKSVSGEGWGRKWSGEQFSDFTLLVSFDSLWPLLKTKQNKIYDKTKCSLKCQPVLRACGGGGGCRSLSPAPSTG